MPKTVKYLHRPILIGTLLFIVSLVYYANAAVNFPTVFNLDNHLNHAATRYLVEHHKLPVVSADNADITFSEIGTTRSLRPPFTYIVSAIVAELAGGHVESQILQQRLGASLIGALTVLVIFVGFYVAFNHTGLAMFGALAIGSLPKFVFLASCNNDDIGAIFSASLLFSSVLALVRYGSKTWVLIALALSCGFVLQTKYSAWLTLPWLIGFSLILLKPVWRKLLRLLPVLLLVGVLAGGWWLAFNMINYGVTDPTALVHAAELQSELSDLKPNSQGYRSSGVSAFDLLSNRDQFLSKSYKSFIGYLEWLELEMGLSAYLFYGMLFLVGFIGVAFAFASKEPSPRKELFYLDIVVVLMIVSQCLFYLHHNLVRDIQPQARYLLPIVMPLMYLFLRAVEHAPNSVVTLGLGSRTYGFKSVASAGLIVTCVLVHMVTMTTSITPAYAARPFHSTVTSPKRFDIQKSFNIVSASDMAYEYREGKLALQRTGNGVPTLTLDSSFCELLPLNALITLNVSSLSKGGITLRLDKNKQGRYDNIVWRSFSAGRSAAIISISSEGCTGAKITLAKRTNKITLDSLQISELKIHTHGKPI